MMTLNATYFAIAFLPLSLSSLGLLTLLVALPLSRPTLDPLICMLPVASAVVVATHTLTHPHNFVAGHSGYVGREGGSKA